MSEELLVYGMKGSPFLRKLQVVPAEKEVAYDFQGVYIFSAPDWFVEISPAKKIPLLREHLPPLFDYLEDSLGNTDYLVGDAFGIADVAVVSRLLDMRFAGGSIDAARWPRLAGYADRVLARPSFAGCVAEESRFFPAGDYQP